MRRFIPLLVASVALTLAAQSDPRDFPNGPAKWLMTPEEQQVWQSVTGEEEARNLIDLFFARRDPTPGTPLNEFRNEFESRVAYADANFKESNRRGALTERGRVLILLGFPKNFGREAAHTTAQFSAAASVNPTNDAPDPTAGRTMAEKETWEYTHEAATKFGVPKIEVVFIHDGHQGAARRDPQRTDFSMALPGAVKSYIVSPDLKTVPDWASSKIRGDRVIAPAQEHIETTITTENVKRQIIIDAPQPVAKAAGAGKLTLLTDIASLKPQSGADPFALASITQFRKDQDLGWAAEYCRGVISPDAPAVKVQLKLAGKAGTISSDPEEFVPDSIKASPGCYLLRGSVPLTDVDPGAYTLILEITGAAPQQSYNLSREFRVE